MTTIESTQSYDDFRRQSGARMAGIFRIYGMPEMPGHVLGALLASAEPVTLGALCTLLGAAKSTVSVAARRLEAFGMVQRSRPLGDRRDHYQVQDELPQLAEHMLQRFLLPEVQATADLVHEMQQALDQGQGPDWPADRTALQERVHGLGALTDGSAAFLGSLLGPDGRLDQARIAQIIALLTQLQETP